MKKSQKRTQIVLLLIGSILFFVTYFYYPNLKNEKITQKPSQKIDMEGKLNNDESTAFEKIEYKGLYDFDKPFVIKSETGYILNDEPDLVYMNKMHVILNLGDGRIVNISSDKGSYNKITYDCFFEDNVKAVEGTTTILAENLDLLATENFVEAYNNVSLDHISGILEADKINYDFITKNFKVSMFSDKTVKMKVIR
jgi:hypothetical protein